MSVSVISDGNVETVHKLAIACIEYETVDQAAIVFGDRERGRGDSKLRHDFRGRSFHRPVADDGCDGDYGTFRRMERITQFGNCQQRIDAQPGIGGGDHDRFKIGRRKKPRARISAAGLLRPLRIAGRAPRVHNGGVRNNPGRTARPRPSPRAWPPDRHSSGRSVPGCRSFGQKPPRWRSVSGPIRACACARHAAPDRHRPARNQVSPPSSLSVRMKLQVSSRRPHPCSGWASPPSV